MRLQRRGKLISSGTPFFLRMRAIAGGRSSPLDCG
jgi:hypothetical protein